MAEKAGIRELFKASAHFLAKIHSDTHSDPFYHGLFTYWATAEDNEKLAGLAEEAQANARRYRDIFRYIGGYARALPEQIPVSCANNIIQSAEAMAVIAARFNRADRLASYLPDRAHGAAYSAAFEERGAPTLAYLAKMAPR